MQLLVRLSVTLNVKLTLVLLVLKLSIGAVIKRSGLTLSKYILLVSEYPVLPLLSNAEAFM